MTMIGSAALGKVFVEIADTLIDEFDVVEFLQTVATRSAELTGTHAAGVLLADDRNRLRFMAASNEQVHLLELFQLLIDVGPCLDCFRSGRAVVNADLRTAQERWPGFAAHAVGAGVISVHAFPLRLRQRVIGTLGLFGTEPATLGHADAEILQALADVATIGILQQRSIRHGEVLTEQLQGALTSRIVIEQAKGVLAQLNGISLDAAFGLLRSYCRRDGLRLSDVATSIVNDPATAADVSKP